MVQEPVTVTFTHPKERVLFNPARDANPFFHLYESLWMLAGWRTVEPLAFYNKRMIEFSDDGRVLNGAYGYRWRHPAHLGGEGLDQLQRIVRHLKEKPESRRAVLQMWSIKDDLLNIDHSKDVCCNTNVYFAIREERRRFDPAMPPAAINSHHYLDMTVCNRSNDLIWGLLGANVVHFSVLQEYLAACIGVEVGVYNQFTNNLHVYLSNWKPEEWLDDAPDWYCDGAHYNVPLVSDPARFDHEVELIVHKNRGEACGVDWHEPFFRLVAQPMFDCFLTHKLKYPEIAKRHADKVLSDDWRTAATNWLARRRKTSHDVPRTSDTSTVQG